MSDNSSDPSSREEYGRTIGRYLIEFYSSPRSDAALPYCRDGREAILSVDAFRLAAGVIGAWPGYQLTPLRSLRGIAAASGVKSVFYKDESTRFGLGSFKALGGAYAVFRLLARLVGERTGLAATSDDIVSGLYADIISAITVTCATDGNHGRSVAWGARMFGCRCVIYIHETVSTGRAEIIAGFGAEIRRVPGNYDDAVRRASADAAREGWHVVSDTSYEGYVDIPRDVMQGYSVMVDEAIRQLPPGSEPTHVFVQGGVGGLAAAVCAHLWQTLGAKRPKFIVVEPDRADCLHRSAVAGQPVAVGGTLDTMMAGLACGEVSVLAWHILDVGADAFVTIDDAAAVDVMRRLAAGNDLDAPIVAGESGVAGLAGFLCCRASPDISASLELSRDSVVLVFGTEGATDPEIYARIVGRPVEEIFR
jgi:diaminopropionate ammonia-lyase